ncbi:MAG TPA: lasso RiPP family leader peptide-containing protein [Gaiellaceae bacterium]|jgi:hypothetical protein|nr:lasso RiPP family leader peptide-containing protein [Gaiellaceae bacterium]
MQQRDRDGGIAAPGYEAPTVRVVGSVHELTQVDKKYGPTDGYTFQGVSITNSSG